jgi:hypothetical protein
MGSVSEINDTLQLTEEQGFPAELDLERHLQTPFATQDFNDKVFTFTNKPGVRVYQAPPVRNFLVESKSGKWIYWGLIHILGVTHDYVNKTTSGTFKVIQLYSPEEMKQAHELIDGNSETRFFN